MAEIHSDSLAHGQVLRGQRDTYTLEKHLGSGLTSHVWLAYDAKHEPVALKCLRADASEVSVEHFWHEADVLAELRVSGAGVYVPQLLDSARTGAVPFLALEFVSQPPYQSLEYFVEKQAAIPEDELLEIVIQALDLLSLLHTKVERSYTDMQLKNFWWDAKAKRLKVMDWNHVSPRRAEIDAITTIADENLRRSRQMQLANWGARDFQGLVQADLARFSSYVYQLATSRPIAASGVTLRELREKGAEGWAALSAGMQQILQRALAVRPAERYESAAAFGRDCRALLNEWQTHDPDEADELVEKIELELDELKIGARNIAAALQTYQTQLDVLNALAQRGKLALNERNLKKVQAQLQSWLRDGTPRWAEGWQMYKIEQYREAQEIWESEAPRLGSVSAYRWLMWVQYLIDNANAINSDARERMENFLQHVEVGEFNEAQRIDLSGLRSSLIDLLRQEVEHQVRIEAARRESGMEDPRRMQRAAGDLRQAHSWLEVQRGKFPEYAQALAETWGDLLAQADSLAQDAYESEIQKQFLERLSDGLRQDFDNGMRDLQQALRAAPNTRIIVKFALNQAESNPNQLSPERVLTLLGAVRSHAYLSVAEQQRVKELEDKIYKLLRERELKQVDDLRTRLLQQIQTTLAQGALHNLPKLAETLATVLDAPARQSSGYREFLRTLNQEFYKALKAGQIESANLCCTTVKLLGEQVDEWEQKIAQRREQLQQVAESAQREQQQTVETKQRQRQQAADALQQVGVLLNGLHGPERIEVQKAYSGIHEIHKTLAENPESAREQAVCQQALDYLNRLRNVFIPLAQYLTRELADLSSSVQKLGKRNQGEFPPLLLQRIERALMAQQQLNQAFYPNLDPELLVATPPLEDFRSLQADCQRELPKILMRVDQALQAEWYRPESVAQVEKKPAQPKKEPDWAIIGLFAIIIVVVVIFVVIFIWIQFIRPGSVQITPTPTIPTPPALTPEGGLLPFAHLMANFLTFWHVF